MREGRRKEVVKGELEVRAENEEGRRGRECEESRVREEKRKRRSGRVIRKKKEEKEMVVDEEGG